MRVRVDAEKCQGHTQCNFTAPQLFRLRDEDGHAVAIAELVPPGQEELARLAESSCPEGAILVSDDE
jgi:ferredoxin